MSDLIERLQDLVDEGPDPTNAPYVIGEHHVEAFRDSITRIDRLTAENEAANLRIEALEGAIPVCRQFMLEVHHAMSQGPGWYTRGESGLRKQIYMWIDRAGAALAATEQDTNE